MILTVGKTPIVLVFRFFIHIFASDYYYSWHNETIPDTDIRLHVCNASHGRQTC